MYRRALKTFAAAALITTIMGTSVFADDLDTLKTQQQEAQQQVDNLTQQLAYLLTEIESLVTASFTEKEIIIGGGNCYDLRNRYADKTLA